MYTLNRQLELTTCAGGFFRPADQRAPCHLYRIAIRRHHGQARRLAWRKRHAAAIKSGCEARALSKDGKPLSGAARNSFIRKCEEGATKPE
jgi:hypothetical protein